ncbi:hypothetical protein VTI74DRAFT_10858 [Chaetomium olivicolor]
MATPIPILLPFLGDGLTISRPSSTAAIITSSRATPTTLTSPFPTPSRGPSLDPDAEADTPRGRKRRRVYHDLKVLPCPGSAESSTFRGRRRRRSTSITPPSTSTTTSSVTSTPPTARSRALSVSRLGRRASQTLNTTPPLLHPTAEGRPQAELPRAHGHGQNQQCLPGTMRFLRVVQIEGAREREWARRARSQSPSRSRSPAQTTKGQLRGTLAMSGRRRRRQRTRSRSRDHGGGVGIEVGVGVGAGVGAEPFVVDVIEVGDGEG